jgi:hypothetical protein
MNDKIIQLDNERLSKEIAEIDWEVEPSRDLWPEIEAQIRFSERAKQRRPSRNWAPFAVAASVTLAVVSLLFSTFTVMNTQQIAQNQQAMMQYQQAQLDLIEEQHQMVRIQFVQLLQQDQDKLNPAFVDEIQQVMADVDEAASQIKGAMKTQPNNPDYASMLVTTYQHEIKLLNRIKSRQGISI